MWCSNCQQDIPAIASPEDQLVRCARCRTETVLPGSNYRNPVRGSIPKATASSLEPTLSPEPAVDETIQHSLKGGVEPLPFDFDSWDWDELSEARRAVSVWGTPTSEEPPTLLPASYELPITRKPARSVRKKSAAPRRSRARGISTFAWCVLSLGVMGCVFGGVLLVWSFLTERPELWSIGLPFAIGGQAALILGLVMQLDGLSQSSDEAVESLGDLDQQLLELRRATSRISSSHSGPARSFYFHMAEGCSPHMLLADLKGQLDLLALRLADDRESSAVDYRPDPALRRSSG